MVMMALLQFELDLAMFRDGDAVGGAWRVLIDPRFWAMTITVIGAAGATLAIGDLIRRDRASGGPTTRMLARSLGVDRRDRRLLGFLARQGDFPSAACLLISRGCFDHAANRASLAAGDPNVTRLRRRLFGGAEEVVHFEDERS